MIADQRIERAKKEALGAKEQGDKAKEEREEDKKQTFQDIRELVAWAIVALGGGTSAIAVKRKKTGRNNV